MIGLEAKEMYEKAFDDLKEALKNNSHVNELQLCLSHTIQGLFFVLQTQYFRLSKTTKATGTTTHPFWNP